MEELLSGFYSGSDKTNILSLFLLYGNRKCGQQKADGRDERGGEGVGVGGRDLRYGYPAPAGPSGGGQHQFLQEDIVYQAHHLAGPWKPGPLLPGHRKLAAGPDGHRVGGGCREPCLIPAHRAQSTSE